MSTIAIGVRGIPAVPTRAPAPDPGVPSRGAETTAAGPVGVGGVRLTRAGRLAITLTVALVAVLAAAITFAATGGASAAPEGRVITIRSGQTLSELALTYLPEKPLAEGIAAIQLANRLQNDRIIAGQELVIPD